MNVFLSRLVQRQTVLELSDRRLARLLHVDSTTLSRWKRHLGAPRIDHLIHLARLLRCEPSWLLGVGGERAGAKRGLDEASYEAGIQEGIDRCREAIRLRATSRQRYNKNFEDSRKGA